MLCLGVFLPLKEEHFVLLTSNVIQILIMDTVQVLPIAQGDICAPSIAAALVMGVVSFELSYSLSLISNAHPNIISRTQFVGGYYNWCLPPFIASPAQIVSIENIHAVDEILDVSVGWSVDASASFLQQSVAPEPIVVFSN